MKKIYHIDPKSFDTDIDEDDEKYYVATGLIDKDAYNEYFKSEVSKKITTMFNKCFKDRNFKYVHFYRVGINNPTDKEYEFSSLWFFDINLKSGYIPIFKAGVNTSSCFAMFMCDLDRDDDDSELTFDELLDFAPCKTSRESVKTILQMNKQKKIIRRDISLILNDLDSLT